MSGKTAIVTVRCANRSVDVQITTQTPIRDLLPLLFDLLNITPPSQGWRAAQEWGLGFADAQHPFPGNATLEDADVHDGAIVLLQNMASWDLHQHVQLNGMGGEEISIL